MNRKPKLLRVTTSDVSLDTLIKGQMKFLSSEFEVVGVSNNTGLLQKVAEREEIRVVEIPMHREISLVADVKCLWMLYRLFRKEKPEIVHANTPKGSLLSMVASWAARIPNRLYTVTGLRYQGASGKFKKLLMMMECISCYCATKVIPEGLGVKKALLDDKITSKEMHVIHNGNINGIDTAFFSPEATVEKLRTDLKLSEDVNADEVRKQYRVQLGISEKDFAFIFVGRIVNDKGMHELAEAMQRLKPMYPNCKLILVGNFEPELDPLKPEDLHFFESDDCVKYVGYQSDVRPFLYGADALVFPSYREGFPNVVMQSGALGLPSIVTDINGCNEIIIENENGVIIPSHDENSLYRAMCSLVDNASTTNAIAKRSRKMIADRYEQQDVWSETLKMYQELLTK